MLEHSNQRKVLSHKLNRIAEMLSMLVNSLIHLRRSPVLSLLLRELSINFYFGGLIWVCTVCLQYYRGGSRISEVGVQMWKRWGGGGSFASFYTKRLEITLENEIIWLRRGLRGNPLKSQQVNPR